METPHFASQAPTTVYYLPTSHHFAFRPVLGALIRANVPQARAEIINRAMDALWAGEWDKPGPDGLVAEAWVLHAAFPHPDPLGRDLPPVIKPTDRLQLCRALHAVRGFPRLKAVDEYVHSLSNAPQPVLAWARMDHAHVYLALRCLPYRAYPETGRQLLDRLILPFRRLRTFCRTYDFVEPEALTQRLDVPQNDDEMRPLAPPTNGRPPKHAERYLTKFRERLALGCAEAEPLQEARWLLAWLREDIEAEGVQVEEGTLPKAETMRNRLIQMYDFKRRALRA